MSADKPNSRRWKKPRRMKTMNDKEIFESVANAIFAAENEWKKPIKLVYVVKVRRYIRDCDGAVYEQHWNIGAFINRERAIEFVRQKWNDIMRDYEELGQKLEYKYWRDFDELEFPNLRNGWLNADLYYDETLTTNVRPFKFEFAVEPMELYDGDKEDDDD